MGNPLIRNFVIKIPIEENKEKIFIKFHEIWEKGNVEWMGFVDADRSIIFKLKPMNHDDYWEKNMTLFRDVIDLSKVETFEGHSWYPEG